LYAQFHSQRNPCKTGYWLLTLFAVTILSGARAPVDESIGKSNCATQCVLPISTFSGAHFPAHNRTLCAECNECFRSRWLIAQVSFRWLLDCGYKEACSECASTLSFVQLNLRLEALLAQISLQSSYRGSHLYRRHLSKYYFLFRHSVFT